MTEQKNRFERYVESQRSIQKESQRRVGELTTSSRKPHYIVKQAKREHSDAKHELRVAKRTGRQSLKANQDLLSARQGVEQAKRRLSEAKLTGEADKVAEAQAALKMAQTTAKDSLRAAKTALKEDLKPLKAAEKVAKVTKKKAIKKTGGSRRRKIARLGLQTTHRQLGSTTNDVLSQDDTLADLAQARQRFTQANITVGQTKQAARLLGSSSKFVLTRSYNIGNRLYNLKKGQGFTLTPKEFSWHGRLGSSYRAWKHKLKQKKAIQTLRGAKRVAGWIAKPLVSVIKNPLTFKSYLIMFGLVFLLAIFGAGGGVSIQDEYDLNQTWLYLTKRDREKSTDKVDYWTNWEDSLLYVNYRYDDIADKINLNADEIMSEQLLGQAYLNTLWDDLNKDENNLKSMSDLYTKTGSIYHLDQEELEAYQELIEETKDDGKFASLVELDNPFYLPEASQYDQPLKITNRFGYIDKTTINKETSLLTTAGQTLYAPMAGTVTVTGQDLLIDDGQARFTFKNITTITTKTGDVIAAGTVIGATSSSNQAITYQKLLTPTSGEKDSQGRIKDQWIDVNPGFYFSHVTYTQATSVLSSIEASGDKAKRARNFYNIIKQREPNATIEGVSAALGGYDIESSITFKRYETDYLTNNQFDKVAAEPTTENLMGSWDAFAQLYAASPPEHRPNPSGYLVNGKHFIGVGIGQWTGPRAFALWEFAKVNNLDMWSEEAQIRFLLEGDSPYYREVFRKTITGTGSTDELTEYFLTNWLGVPGNKLAQRQNAAKQWQNFLKGRATGSTGVASQTIPDGYKDKLPYGLPSDRAVLAGQGYPGNGYELGNCTWYVYNRMEEVGTPIYAYLGDANMWADSGRARGYTVTTTPRVGSAAVFLNGVAGAHVTWGHVGFVEYVNPDGTFLMSEMNFTGLYNLTWRTLSPQVGIYFVTPN